MPSELLVCLSLMNNREVSKLITQEEQHMIGISMAPGTEKRSFILRGGVQILMTTMDLRFFIMVWEN